MGKSVVYSCVVFNFSLEKANFFLEERAVSYSSSLEKLQSDYWIVSWRNHLFVRREGFKVFLFGEKFIYLYIH